MNAFQRTEGIRRGNDFASGRKDQGNTRALVHDPYFTCRTAGKFESKPIDRKAGADYTIIERMF